MHMYSPTIMLTNIVTEHVTAPGHKELLTMMSDSIWNHLAQNEWTHCGLVTPYTSHIFVNSGSPKGLKYFCHFSVKK